MHDVRRSRDSTKQTYLGIVISGAGFLADAYDLFVINIAVDLMDLVDYKEPLTQSLKSTLKTTALLGAMFGQIGFGISADLIGRRKVFIVTCSLVILGAIMSATVQDTAGSFGIYSQLAMWRFVLGVGVGGEYPLSAAITSESCRPQDQARNLALVFSMQGLGTMLCAVVLVVVTSALGDNYDVQWRLALAMGAFPMICAFYFRWKLHEHNWTIPADSEHEVVDAVLEPSSLWSHCLLHRFRIGIAHAAKMWIYFINGAKYARVIVLQNRWRLLGTAGAWFILDVVFYANGLFSGQVTKAMGIAQIPRGEALASLILQAIALPGYFFTVFFIERIGLKRLQSLGFFLTSFFFFFLAGFQPSLIEAPGLYIFIYGITFFFQNFGANATTYIIPSIVYSKEHKATCHGISSAAGKLGAIIGAQLFLSLEESFCVRGVCSRASSPREVNAGLRATFAVCGAFSIVGLIWTYFLVPVDIHVHGGGHNDALTSLHRHQSSLYASAARAIHMQSFVLVPMSVTAASGSSGCTVSPIAPRAMTSKFGTTGYDSNESFIRVNQDPEADFCCLDYSEEDDGET